jgi:hypothetical protein
MTASISSLTTSVVALQQFTGNINTRFDRVQTYTTSVDSRFTTLAIYTSSVETRFTTLENVTTSVDTRFTTLSNVTASLNESSASQQISIDNLNIFSGSQLSKDTTLSTYTASIDDRFTTLQQVTSSVLQYTASVSQSIRSLNIFSSSYYIDSASFDYRISILDPGNLDDVLLGLNQHTASANGRFTEIGVVSGSLISSASAAKTTNDSQDVSITNINLTTASLNTSVTNINSFSSSVLSQLTAVATITGSLINSASNASTRLDALETETSNLELYTQSVENRFTNLASYTGSTNTSITSLNSFTQSANITLNNIESFTSSINTTIKDKLNEDGVVSGSSQILGNSTIHSGSIGNYQFNSIGIGTAASTVEGELRATGDIVAFYSSDERLKENIQPIVDALSKVESISGNTYDWKEGFETIHSHTGNDIGVIAQEIEKVLPEVVTNRETGYKAVQYEKIVPLLIEAIKELSAKVKELEKK